MIKLKVNILQVQIILIIIYCIVFTSFLIRSYKAAF